MASFTYSILLHTSAYVSRREGGGGGWTAVGWCCPSVLWGFVSVCVCVCVSERERVCVREREREGGRGWRGGGVMCLNRGVC